MQDFLFINFFLGHKNGEEARLLLQTCDLLETAIADRANRHSWSNSLHLGVSIRLPVEDPRLRTLLERLGQLGIEPFTRIDREYTRSELDHADWLMLRIATAGLYGGVDYDQEYTSNNACITCGSGAEPIPPLIAELGKMGKKEIDHLVYEGHLIAPASIAQKLDCLSGIELTPVRSPRRPSDPRFCWLKIESVFPKMQSSTIGICKVNVCPTCGRSGHYGNSMQPETLVYKGIPKAACDFNRTWEYFGDWQQVRSKSVIRRVGGSYGIIVSQRARQALQELRVRRLVWVPITILG